LITARHWRWPARAGPIRAACSKLLPEAAVWPKNAMKGHVARKRFGQNFLVDPGIIAAIVSAVDLRRDETVVEIGPGWGQLPNR
jgi:protein-L-isoaspartate O-methyltransferase